MKCTIVIDMTTPAFDPDHPQRELLRILIQLAADITRGGIALYPGRLLDRNGEVVGTCQIGPVQ